MSQSMSIPVQLGKLCNKPFRITTIAIKSGTAEEISAIVSEKKDK
jgi:ribosomal protein L30E